MPYPVYQTKNMYTHIYFQVIFVHTVLKNNGSLKSFKVKFCGINNSNVNA